MAMKSFGYDFLKRNILNIILTIGVPLSLWFYFQRDIKEITITYESNTPVVSVNNSLSQGISISYNSIPIESMNVLTFLVSNSGNRPIEKSSYDKPVSIIFNNETPDNPIITKKLPEQLDPILSLDKQSELKISPLLLNPGDCFEFRISLVNAKSQKPSFKVDGRIVGVPRIIIKDNSDSKSIFSVFSTIYLNVAISMVALLITMASGVKVLMNFLKYNISKNAIEKTIIAGKNINITPEIRSYSKNLAERLNIQRYDVKSNLLMLRIKIEDLVNELVRMHGGDSGKKSYSIAAKIRNLAQKEVVPYEMVSAINDILPAINGELHNNFSYINNTSFETIQEIALNVVSVLESKLLSANESRKISSSICLDDKNISNNKYD
ncbi:hypothetical protein [Desulfovibrio sp. DV]|uniref:hypothetical protein n=1 Tax=Desulfovibrio sp. DV TaxID=1844708 RepID=UPI0011151EA1|nr:hypothetical protein [Desulfovibrio sp. DV]